MGRVLVTGGAGFIGSFATQALLRAGHETVVYDDLSQGHREAVERLAAQHPGKVTLIEGDIRDTAKVRDALAQHRVEAVMHFAAKLIVNESVHQPGPYYDTNVGGALSVLNAMRDAGVSRFIFSSTCATFGEPVKTPMGEDHPQRPINAYGETKLAVERALPHYERAYGIRWVALRYFNAAGADPDGVIGEDHTPEIHLIPRAIDATHGSGAAGVVRGGLSDARRDVPEGLHPRPGPGGRASARAWAAGGRRGLGGIQSGDRDTGVGPGDPDQRGAGHRPGRAACRQT